MQNKKSNHSTTIILATILFALIAYSIYQQYYNLLPEEKLAFRGAEKIKLAMYEPESLVFYKVFVNTQGNVCYIFSGKNMLRNIGEEQKTVYLANETLTFNSIKPFEDNCINRQGKDLTLLLKKKYQNNLFFANQSAARGVKNTQRFFHHLEVLSLHSP